MLFSFFLSLFFVFLRVVAEAGFHHTYITTFSTQYGILCYDPDCDTINQQVTQTKTKHFEFATTSSHINIIPNAAHNLTEGQELKVY